MATFLHVLRDIGLFIARIGLGGLLIAHGWRRWQVLGVQSQVDYLTQFGTPYPRVAAYGAIVLELVGGIFLVVGALTPLVALAVLVQQILIICYTNWYMARNLLTATGSPPFEHAVTIGLLALLFVVFGAGRASIDRLFRRNKNDPDDYDDDDTPVAATVYKPRS